MIYYPTLAVCQPGESIFEAAEREGYKQPEYLISTDRYKSGGGYSEPRQREGYEAIGTVTVRHGESFLIYRKLPPTTEG